MTVQEAPAMVKNKKDREKDWLNEEVYFEFSNIEEPGVMVTFSFGPTDNIKKYVFMHGGKYRAPRSVVQHVESRQVPIWKYKPDGEGGNIKTLDSYKSRFQCRQLFE